MLPRAIVSETNSFPGANFFSGSILVPSSGGPMSAGSGRVAGIVVAAGETKEVFSGGSAVDSEVQSGGVRSVYSGGTVEAAGPYRLACLLIPILSHALHDAIGEN